MLNPLKTSPKRPLAPFTTISLVLVCLVAGVPPRVCQGGEGPAEDFVREDAESETSTSRNVSQDAGASSASPKAQEEQAQKFPFRQPRRFDPVTKFTLNYNERPRLYHTNLATVHDIEHKRVPCNDPGAASCRFRAHCGAAPLNRLTPKNRGRATGYVVGGMNQAYGEFPSFARLEIMDTARYASINCGGTLVTDRHIITAAHCVYSNGGESRSLVKPMHVRVVMGDHSVDEGDKFEQEIAVRRICASTKYHRKDKLLQVHDDWALIELDEPAKLNEHVQAACLPFESIQRHGNSSMCYLVGSGVIETRGNGHNVHAEVVQKMRVEQVSCRVWNLHDRDATRECYSKAGVRNGDSCLGDSGGPVLCLDGRRRWTLAAAVSYGTAQCNAAGAQAWVGVYSRMRTLLSEIKETCPF